MVRLKVKENNATVPNKINHIAFGSGTTLTSIPPLQLETGARV
jgi:hypothetical protein